MNPQLFRGRTVYDGIYPEVYWPDHPLARANGLVRIHRIVALEKYGHVPAGAHVHHKDRNRWNWEPDNLELMKNGREHSLLHRPAVIRRCEVCQKQFSGVLRRATYKHVYCSQECSHKAQRRIEWPDYSILSAMVKASGYSAVGRQLGVSDKAVKKHLRGSGRSA